MTHWAEGGETKLENLVLLCRHHHRLVHEGGWTVDWWGPGQAVFFDPRGGTHFEGGWQWPGITKRPLAAEEAGAPAPASGEATAHPVETLMEENQRKGAVPDGLTASARWEREADIPDEVSSGAWEAML